MKKFLIAALAISICMVLVACGPSDAENIPTPAPTAGTEMLTSLPDTPAPSLANCEEPDPISVWTVAEGVTASLLQDTYPAGTESLTLVMDNQTDRELDYGEAIYFQKYVDGSWQPAEVRDDYAWNDIAYMLLPHTVRTFPISTLFLSQPLAEGLYRVTSEDMWFSDGEEVPGFQVEFRISPDAQPEPDYALYVPVQPVAGTGTIPVQFLNTTGEDAYVLDIPHLDRQETSGTWAEVPYREQVGFCGTPSALPPPDGRGAKILLCCGVRWSLDSTGSAMRRVPPLTRRVRPAAYSPLRNRRSAACPWRTLENSRGICHTFALL